MQLPMFWIDSVLKIVLGTLSALLAWYARELIANVKENTRKLHENSEGLAKNSTQIDNLEQRFEKHDEEFAYLRERLDRLQMKR